MSDVASYLETLSGDPIALLVSALVFVTVFVGVLAVGRHLTSPRVPDRSSPGMRPGVVSTNAVPTDNQVTTGDVAPPARARQMLLTVHRAISVLAVGVLLALTVISYWSSSPDDGSMLVPAMLAVVTLIVWLKLHNWRERYGPADADPAVRSDLVRTIQADLSEKIAAALLDPARVKWEVASPEVYRMDAATLERARAMAIEGRSMDEICRSVQADYDRWDGPHQQAFQAVMREAVAHRA